MNGPDPEVSHRRRPTGQPVERPAGEDPAHRHVPDRADLLELVEQLALELGRLALPPMPARVLAYALVADHDTHTAAQFAEGLVVSPAAISGALHQLMDLGLLNRTREPGLRSHLYALAQPNPPTRLPGLQDPTGAHRREQTHRRSPVPWQSNGWPNQDLRSARLRRLPPHPLGRCHRSVAGDTTARI